MAQTILVTGATGYLGSWIAKYLLAAGYNVRITVRDKSQDGKFAYLEKIAADSKGEIAIYEADLLQPDSYNKAAEGCYAIIHVASPFTLRFKDALKEIIEPAILGTKNVLAAATASTTVKKVILTSSIVAVHGDNIDMREKGLNEFTEDDFNTSSTETHQPYSYAKVKAELAAWDLAKEQEQWKLVVMNPGFVMGPPISANTNSESIQFMKDMLSGKFLTGVPYLEFAFVDVRDVARAHMLALENDHADGRYIIVEKVMDFMSFAKTIKTLYPGKYALPLMLTPKIILYLVGWIFGLTAKFISRNVGYRIKINNTKSKKNLRLSYLPLETTVKDMIERMKALKMVKP